MKFTEEEKKKIADAVKEVELHSSAEIVPYFVSKSNDYLEVRFYLAALFGLVSCILVVALSLLWLLPTEFNPVYFSLFIVFSMLVGFGVTTLFPSLTRFFVPNSRLFKYVFARAETAFLEEEVFNTRDRTGILIFISELEHQALVLGDTGISSKVKTEEWEHVISLIINGIKQKTMADGIVNAISACKELLLKEGIVVRPDDTDELSNEIRIKE